MTRARDLVDPPWTPVSPAHYLAEHATTVPDLFLQRVDRSGSRKAYYAKIDGQWKPTTWRQMGDRARAFGSWLIANGVESGDKVCIVGSTRPEWCLCDVGGQLAGAVTLGAYPTLTPQQLAYVVDHSDTKVLVVEGEADLAKVREQRDATPKVEHIIVWDGEHDGTTSLSDVLSTPVDDAGIAARVEAVDPADTAIIVYTSGTTGPPKGAMISHKNILTILAVGHEALPAWEEDDVSFNFLPMAHVAERVLGFYGRINGGISNYFASSIPKVLEEVQETKPTIFGSVPRIFEKAYAKIMSQVEQAPKGRQRIFHWAERTGREVVRRWQRDEEVPLTLAIQYRLADRLVFSKIRQFFGGRVRYFVTGAAPIATEILEFFWAAGFRIFEAYGMTEATVITHANRPGEVRLGSVGRPLPFAKQKIAADGEILIEGDVVFQGYYKNPDATAETILDGWLHTGDIGEVDADGFLTIKDRKKHIIITAGGKNLTPANIENDIKASDPIISQAHAHGDRRKFLVALVTIGPAESIEWAREHGLCTEPDAERLLAEFMANPFARPKELNDLMGKVTAERELQDRVVEAVRRANKNLSRVETIKKVFLLDRELSVEEDELTPTLKVKRKRVEEKFAPMFDRLYDEDSFGLTI